MKKALIALAAVAALAGCTNEDDTRRTLDSMGFTEITTKDYSWFACGDDYTYATRFTAKNPAGKMVSGTVCCGIYNGCSAKF